MTNAVVVYASQSGFTQKYAMWIARVLHCEVLDSTFVTSPDLVSKRLVVYGAHAKRASVLGFRQFYARFQLALPEQLIVFGTGVLPPDRVDFAAIRAKTFKHCTQHPQLFYFDGKVDPDALPLRLKVPFQYHQRQLTAAPPEASLAVVWPLLQAVDDLEVQGLL